MHESKIIPVSISLLMGKIKNSYVSIRICFLEEFELENTDFPTYHYVTKNRPKFLSRIFNLSNKHALLTRKIKIKKISKNSETKKLDSRILLYKSKIFFF